MTTEEQITLARKFAGRFQQGFTSGAVLGVVGVCSTKNPSNGWQHDLAILARAETLLAEANAKPAERVKVKEG